MLDECCRPMKLLLWAMINRRTAFVCEAVVELEAIAPEVVASMLEQSSGVYSISEDGTQAISRGSGKVRWDAAKQPTGLTIVHPEQNSGIHSAAACVVKNADLFTFFSQPCKLYACAKNAVGFHVPYQHSDVTFLSVVAHPTCKTRETCLRPFSATSPRTQRAHLRRGFDSTRGIRSCRECSG